jgi:hypothetical protein
VTACIADRVGLGRVGGWIDGWMDGWIDGWIEVNGWMDRDMKG